jgi:predicted nucleic-acid-binding protein
MKAVGIDTCVILRLLVGEPEDQAALAYAFIEKRYYDGIAVCVSDMVVAESYHALIYHYDVPKPKALETLRKFLASPMITTTGHAMPILMSYTGTRPGLVDRLIRADLLDNTYEVRTFDRNFASMENVELID